MKNNNFDFSETLTVAEWFKSKGVRGPQRTYFIKECISDEGEAFMALALHNGEVLKDGRAAYSFFVLSKKLHADYTLNKSFLQENAGLIHLIDAEDLGTKFGVIYLPKATEVWDFD